MLALLLPNGPYTRFVPPKFGLEFVCCRGSGGRVVRSRGDALHGRAELVRGARAVRVAGGGRVGDRPGLRREDGVRVATACSGNRT